MLHDRAGEVSNYDEDETPLCLSGELTMDALRILDLYVIARSEHNLTLYWSKDHGFQIPRTTIQNLLFLWHALAIAMPLATEGTPLINTGLLIIGLSIQSVCHTVNLQILGRQPEARLIQQRL